MKKLRVPNRSPLTIDIIDISVSVIRTRAGLSFC